MKKITFVTESHAWGDEKDTVEVLVKRDLEKVTERVNEEINRANQIHEFINSVDELVRSLEKRLSAAETTLADFEKRIRDDCRDIFAGVIDDALNPVFSTVEQLVNGRGTKAVAQKSKSDMLKKTKTVKKIVSKPKATSSRSKKPKTKGSRT